jgi:hypothetical protein
MPTVIDRVVAEFRAWDKPRDGVSENPFRLVCALEVGATEAEIDAAWEGTKLPGELREFWRQSRAARLFEDIDYGQWGLRILAPGESSERTAGERRDRPHDVRPTDLVVGEFIGDQELLVLASDEGGCEVLVSLPLDPRSDWYRVDLSFGCFLDGYLSAAGEKFWEWGASPAAGSSSSAWRPG